MSAQKLSLDHLTEKAEPLHDGNRFTTLHEDASGLWVGTERGHLTRFAAGRFTTYTKDDGLPDAEIRAIRADGAGRLWVFSSLGIAEWKEGKFVRPAPGELESALVRRGWQ